MNKKTEKKEEKIKRYYTITPSGMLNYKYIMIEVKNGIVISTEEGEENIKRNVELTVLKKIKEDIEDGR